MNLYFTRPEMFVYLFGLIPIALLFIIHYKRRYPVIAAFLSGRPVPESGRKKAGLQERRASTFTGEKKLKKIYAGLKLRYLASSLSFLFFLACAVTALADPRMGTRLVREFRRGCDVMLAIDVSRSMMARDSTALPGSASETKSASRLERALWAARHLVLAGEDPAIRAGLVAGGGHVNVRFALTFGKGHSVLALPVTSDYEAVFRVLDSLSPEVLSARGTNLEELIDTASGGFPENSPAGRFILLFSDGEGVSGVLSGAVERAMQADITVIAVGIGSAAGILLPENGASAEADSKLVRSYLHADELRSAVERSGGYYIDGNNNEVLSELAQKIFPQAGDSSWVFREEAGARWYIVLGAGILALAFSVLVRKKRKYARSFAKSEAS